MSLPTSRAFVTQLLNSLSAVPLPTNDSTAVEEASPLHAVSDATKKQLLSLQVLFPNEFVPALDLLDRRLVTRFRIFEEEQLVAEGLRGTPDHGDAHMQDSEETAQTDDARMKNLNNAVDELTNRHEATALDALTIGQTLLYDKSATIYYVRSAQARPAHFATSYDTTSSYEVRLQAWNCSCPAFAFSAFPLSSSPPICAYNAPDQLENTSDTGNDDHRNDVEEWSFGGITLGSEMPPVCKHLLACVLLERCKGLFGECVEERSVGWEERCKGLFGGFMEERNVSVEEAAGWAAGWGD
jgi:hypothetical protein